MSPEGSGGRGPTWRLRGEVNGGLVLRLLGAGQTLVGYLPGAALSLPVRGVSRRHALLVPGEAALEVRDLGSKNGTFLNGEPIREASASPGDELRFGPVSFWVEAIPHDEVELAIQLDTPPAAAAGEAPTDWLAPPREAGGGPALAVVEPLLRHLEGPEADLASALAGVVAATAAEGGAVGDWTGSGKPALFASHGDLGGRLEHPELASFLRAVFAQGARMPVARSMRLAVAPELLCSARRRPGADLLLCLLKGSSVPQEDAAALASLLLHLFDHSRAAPGPVATPPPAPGRPAAGLPIPIDFVRGLSPGMERVYELLDQARSGDFPVLIAGDTGTGKEHLVRLLHDGSPRREGPLVAVNCAAIPADLLEAEMFGVTRGVATGVQERPGKFQLADGGTLFLDEIGEMPLGLQPKLLRALESREVAPLGGRPVPASARIVAATNVDLEQRVATGRFRADLYYRVAGFEVRVPPLRDRREDVPGLVQHFLGRFSQQAGKALRGVTLRALEALVAYDWPGNVRELENEVRRLAYLCPAGAAIDSTLLAERVRRAISPEEVLEGGRDLAGQVAALERRLIRAALRDAGGNQSEAARRLGISRNGLAKKARRLGLRLEP